ncbi:MAG: hypothetical protein WD250_16675 [Egibacteraceae bacterium]
MADTPLPPPPSAPNGQVPPPPAPARRPPPGAGVSRVVVWVVVGLVVVVAGCSTVLYVGGSRLVRTARAPVDTANEFLDGVRAGGPAAAGREVCPGAFELADELATSEGQHLSEVHVAGSGTAAVSGTVTLAGGRTRPLTVELRRLDDGWCVSATRFETAPG